MPEKRSYDFNPSASARQGIAKMFYYFVFSICRSTLWFLFISRIFLSRDWLIDRNIQIKQIDLKQHLFCFFYVFTFILKLNVLLKFLFYDSVKRKASYHSNNLENTRHFKVVCKKVKNKKKPIANEAWYLWS